MLQNLHARALQSSSEDLQNGHLATQVVILLGLIPFGQFAFEAWLRPYGKMAIVAGPSILA